MKLQAMARPITLGSAGRRQQRGFGYLAVLFLVMLLALALGATYEQIGLKMQREREQQWMFAGKQYQQAIASYYHQSPNGIKELPTSLDDLLKDKRFVSNVRHLRKRYADPLTGEDWVLIMNENQQITGIYSKSNAAILQTAQLSENDLSVSEQTPVYANVKFEFSAAQSPPASDAEATPKPEDAAALDNVQSLE